MTNIQKCREIVETKTARRIDGVLVDTFTASAIVTVYDALNDRNKATLAAKNIHTMALIALKCMKGKG